MAVKKKRAKTSTPVRRRRAKRTPPRRKPREASPRQPRLDREALADFEKQVRRLRAARRTLERQLTTAVQEIGTLRQFELRATMLEAELEKRTAELARLRSESEERVRDLELRLGGASIVSTPS